MGLRQTSIGDVFSCFGTSLWIYRLLAALYTYCSIYSQDRPIAMDIQPDQHRFPFCLVWTPIPLISWLFPYVGHMGIASSQGVIYDFAGSYFVSVNQMAFGWPTRYLQLFSPSRVNVDTTLAYDRSIMEASEEYKSHTHNICCDNCHSHVAMALNSICYKGRSNWDMVKLCVYMAIAGKPIGWQGFLKQFLPFIILIILAFIVFFFVLK